jgi:DNA-directed RNA polymerase beta subunit
MAPNTYQRLCKFVADETYSIYKGPISELTHQGLTGKNKLGGLRLGEMERDVLISHGTIGAFSEKWNDHADGCLMYICRNCKQKAIVNDKIGKYACKECKDMGDIVSCQSSWCANLFNQETAAMNVKQKFELENYTYSRQSID